MRLLITLGALALAGCTANAELQASRQAEAAADLAKALDGRVAGKPQNCLSSPNSTNGPQIIDAKTILYRDGKRVWRNELAAECPSLDQDSILVVEMNGSQICKNDLFRPVDRGSRIPGAYCRFGEFTPYVKE
ncbi:hypothetical protein [Sphingomonas sp. LM7]|uniref:hypothetical protein n=1 Tax=Sphingomonas sp. LM7 TaxID=1938607 RepID=UPI000983ADF2|nr:hypothetical protein [Sphingomonas sp. LM7]AQR74233.1 hypothetical protein BXU08_11730 [Sphingomonas sp. LM7]